MKSNIKEDEKNKLINYVSLLYIVVHAQTRHS